MATTNDTINEKLRLAFPTLTHQGDLLAAFWNSKGYQNTGPGDTERAFYIAQGATGLHLGDARYDYWTNIFTSGGSGFRILMETGDAILTEAGDALRTE